ncbi:MAG: M23 family metallopeptidase [Epulopiscium sp.]|nr:M23 family metallopeptidase [Candidatus Epulonipiscium sp.]
MILRREVRIYNEEWINPVEGIITSYFGERINPVLNKKEFHDGIDIAAPKDEPIVAVKSGTVIKVESSSTYGKLIEYEVEGGYIIKYAHCNEIFVKEGDRVEQGQIVASIGNTGLSTGYHLHYTILKDEVCIDPVDFVDLPIMETLQE